MTRKAALTARRERQLELEKREAQARCAYIHCRRPFAMVGRYAIDPRFCSYDCERDAAEAAERLAAAREARRG